MRMYSYREQRNSRATISKRSQRTDEEVMEEEERVNQEEAEEAVITRAMQAPQLYPQRKNLQEQSPQRSLTPSPRGRSPVIIVARKATRSRNADLRRCISRRIKMNQHFSQQFKTSTRELANISRITKMTT